jgi:hypothetical protein
VGGEDALAVQLSACSGGARGYDDVQQPQTRLGLDSVKAVRINTIAAQIQPPQFTFTGEIKFKGSGMQSKGVNDGPRP